jgi:hypothetical protein
VWLVLKGSIDVVRRDGLNREAAITSHGICQFSGEVSQLAGQESLRSPDRHGGTASSHLRWLTEAETRIARAIAKAKGA